MTWSQPSNAPTDSASRMDYTELASNRRRRSRNELYGTSGDHSGLMPANLITLPHFSVSSAMSLPKSVEEPGSTFPPRSASRAFNLGSESAALISVLSLSMISLGVFFGAPTPNQALAS